MRGCKASSFVPRFFFGTPVALITTLQADGSANAHADIVVPHTQHIDTARWSPLLYVFRHYFGTGARLGRNFRADH